jgi:hypothetical protein
VPYTSMRGRSAAHTSKLIISVVIAPPSCSSTPATCVRTSTGNSVPARGPLPITRVARGDDARPVTRRTGPSNVTSAVR